MEPLNLEHQDLKEYAVEIEFSSQISTRRSGKSTVVKRPMLYRVFLEKMENIRPKKDLVSLGKCACELTDYFCY